jgi:hypothetical protein
MHLKSTLAERIPPLLATIIYVALAATSAQAQFLWSERIASTTSWPEGEPNIGLSLDTNGNCYVTGWFDGTNNFGGIIRTNKSSAGSDIFIAKYDVNGACQWVNQAGGTTSNYGRAIGTDVAGNVYVTGGFSGSAKFGSTTMTAPLGTEFFLAQYDKNGSLKWVRQSTGGTTDVYGIGLAACRT